jgi:hypothetical protein
MMKSDALENLAKFYLVHIDSKNNRLGDRHLNYLMVENAIASLKSYVGYD